jgi:hypothetical protein
LLCQIAQTGNNGLGAFASAVGCESIRALDFRFRCARNHLSGAALLSAH